MDTTRAPVKTVRWSLAGCCRIHKVTIREIKAHTGITLKRIREIRDMGEVPEFTAWEFVQAIRGVAALRAQKP